MGTKKRKAWRLIRVEEVAHKIIKKLAKKRGQSMSQVIISLVETQ